ncbi:hypothetical protein LTR67_001390 [Exophiala xenobiotica]
MAKVKQKGRKVGPAGGTSTRGAQVARERNKHKVVVQGASKDQKQLQSVVRPTGYLARGITYRNRQVTFRADPPQGYTFIPAGNPELTAALKEFARRGDHKIFAVTTTPHAARHELSREVHRIGFHFPTSVVAQVCAHYGIRLTTGGKVIDDTKDDKLFEKVYQNGQRPKDDPKDQITINTEAKQTIKDLFPKIPDNDLFQIIKTAFQLGDNKVGTADEIPLVRRAQLSVVAHIRHVYTEYDKLLRRCPYNEARHAVEQDTLAKLIEWRGDNEVGDEATQRAADDLLREVIVISDEDDNETDTDDVQIVQDNVRVEELPSTAYGAGLGRPASPLRDQYGQAAVHHYQNLPRVVPRYKPKDDAVAQRDRSRYAVWDQARRDYRAGVMRQPVAVLERAYEPEDPPSTRILVPLDPPAAAPPQVVYSRPPPPTMSSIDYEPRYVRQQSPRTYIRGADGTLYERIDPRPREVYEAHRPADRTPRAIPAPEHRIRTRPSSPLGPNYSVRRKDDEFDGGDGTIIPSIEGHDGAHLSPSVRRNPFERHPALRDTNLARENGVSYREAPVFELADNDPHFSKRRRLEEPSTLPDHRFVRRESPVRYQERVYVPHPDHVHATTRPINYGEPRASPVLRPAVPATEIRRYVQRLPDVNGASHPGPLLHRDSDAPYDLQEPARMQPRYPPHVQGSNRFSEVQMSMHRRDIENHSPAVVSRVYEPLDDHRIHDGRVLMDRHMAAFEPHVQSSQRVYEYDDRAAVIARPYAHVAR